MPTNITSRFAHSARVRFVSMPFFPVHRLQSSCASSLYLHISLPSELCHLSFLSSQADTFTFLAVIVGITPWVSLASACLSLLFFFFFLLSFFLLALSLLDIWVSPELDHLDATGPEGLKLSRRDEQASSMFRCRTFSAYCRLTMIRGFLLSCLT
ncbi:hypothetical protein VTN02DRAFT_4083 [Thermoascus thermophilus]